MHVEAYSYSAFVASAGKVAPEKLRAEVLAVVASAVCKGARVDDGSQLCSIYFDTVPSAGDKTLLDGVVAAHNGIETALILHGTWQIAGDEKAIAAVAPAWDIVGGIVGAADHFLGTNLAGGIGRVHGRYKASGGTLEARIVEEDGDVTMALNSAPVALVDTAGAWKIMELVTDIAPAAGDHEYRLELRLGTATAGSVRSVALALFEIQVL